MQLDKTDIVIRDRGWGEMLDLALPVMRRHSAALLWALMAGAVPLALLNYFLLHGFLEAVDETDDFPLAFVGWQLVLTALEIPIATSFVTLYLGKSMFLLPTTPRQICRDFLGSLPQLIWYQLIIRGTVGAISIGLAPYCGWPYLNEVILLERHPWWPRKANGKGKANAGAKSDRQDKNKEKPTFRRSSELHSGFGGEFFAIWLGSMLLGAALVVSLCLSVMFLRELLSGESEFDWWIVAVALPAVQWLAVGYFAVVRYLGYLTLRIRNEGWEIEIKLRAERARLIEQVA